MVLRVMEMRPAAQRPTCLEDLLTWTERLQADLSARIARAERIVTSSAAHLAGAAGAADAGGGAEAAGGAVRYSVLDAHPHAAGAHAAGSQSRPTRAGASFSGSGTRAA
jgi:hypothetical protein